MNTEALYKKFKDDLLSALAFQRDIAVFNSNKHIFNNQIFNLTNEDMKLYKEIANKFKIIIIDRICELLINLCKVYEIPVEFSCGGGRHYAHHLIIRRGGEKICLDFSFGTFGGFNSFVRDKCKDNGEEYFPIFMSKEINNLTEEERKKYHPLTLFECFEKFFGTNNADLLRKTVNEINNEIPNVIGFQLTEILNEHNLKILKEELIKEFVDFDYEYMRHETYLEIKKGNEKFSDIFDSTFTSIFNNFIYDKKYVLLLGQSNFANTFLSSSWLFRQYLKIPMFDKTYLVTGYLKSVEQLLSKLLSIKKINYSEGGVSEKYDDATLGKLEYEIGNYDNCNLFILKNKFMCNYLKGQIDLWREKNRNYYLHKENLQDIAKVVQIRKETFFLYCLILGSFDLSDEEIDKLLF